MDKVALYCRLSVEDLNKSSNFDESESIQNQKTLLTMYAVEQGWPIYKIYCDDDYSGLDADRPEFNQMLCDAQVGMFNIILCKSQSRFTRDMELVEKYLHNKFIEWSIRFIGLTDNVDTLEKGNKKSRQIYGLVNEWYCEDISEAIKATFKAKRETGKFIGSFASYGFDKDPCDNNRLIIDQEAANIVRMIFDWYLEGSGTQHIAHMLNEKGIPNPTKYKHDKGLKFQNASKTDGYGLWNKTTVKRILKNEMYIGNMVQGKRKKVSYKSKKIFSANKNEWVIISGVHEAIIEERIFQVVQDRMAGRMRSSGEGQAHIFATKVRCMDCHNTMNKVTSSNKDYVYLRCKLYCLGANKGLCSKHSIRLDQLEKIVLQNLIEHIKLLCNDDDLAYRLQHEEALQSKLQLLETELAHLKKDIIEKEKMLKNLYIDKLKGLIPEQQFVDFNSTFISEKEKLLETKENIENKILQEKNKSYSNEYWVEAVRKYKEFKTLTRSMINELIDFIEIGENNIYSNNQKIRIHWLF